MPCAFPAAVIRQTRDQIELFILDREDESLAVRPALFPVSETGKMTAYRMRWLRNGRYFAVTTHPDGHATDSRRPETSDRSEKPS